MADWTISNCYLCYIENDLYTMPSDADGYVSYGTSKATGWHVIPTMLWKHFCTPKQWHDLLIKNQSYCLQGYTVTVFNMIPMTEILAIQRTGFINAFNNCVYAWGYQDVHYETPWESWTTQTGNSPNLAWREGVRPTSSGQATVKRFMLPKYLWKYPNFRSAQDDTWGNMSITGSGKGVYPPSSNIPTGVIWNPL